MGEGPLRAALVGLGWWGRQIVDAVADSELVSIAGAVDPRVDQCQDFADSHGLHLTNELAEVLGDDSVEAVMIATPHGLHESQVLAVAEADKHVFCEKPLALDAAAARRMVDACRRRGLVLGVGHERRFEGAWEEMARMVEDGDLGTLLHVDCNWSHNLFAGATTSSWRQDPQQAPAGTLTALGVHVTDFFQSVAGPVAELGAISTHRSDDFPTEDVITVQFRFASGVTGFMCNLATTPFHSRMTLFGDRGWVEARENSNVDIPEPATLTRRGTDNEIHTRTFTHTNTVGTNIDQWAGAALGIGEYRFTHEQLIHNVEILEAIVASTKSGAMESIG